MRDATTIGVIPFVQWPQKMIPALSQALATFRVPEPAQPLFRATILKLNASIEGARS